MKRLKAEQIAHRMKAIPAWSRRRNQICRIVDFSTFAGAIRFVDRVARLADRSWHHPDIDIRYTRVILNLTTHDAGGLTKRDFDLARRIDGLYKSK